nr:MAG TPA: protein of unknown function (DUF4376) [Caudoviricetes sp.]
MNYLIKFDENGRRGETYVAEEKTAEEIQALLNDNFELIPEEDYQLLIGNKDGKEYIHNTDGTYSEYIPPEPPLAELKAAKLAEVNAWTAAKITGGFVSNASGAPVTYDSDKDTQLTMQGIALNVNSELFAEKYPTGCPVRGYPEGSETKQIFMLTPEQVMRWQADLSMHIGTCKQQGWEKQAEVAAAETKEDLDAIALN